MNFLRFLAMQHSIPFESTSFHFIPVQFSRYNFRLHSLRIEGGKAAESTESLICYDLSCSCSGNERICVNRLNKVDWSVAEFGIGIGIGIGISIGIAIGIEIGIGIEGKLDRIVAHGAYAWWTFEFVFDLKLDEGIVHWELRTACALHFTAKQLTHTVTHTLTRTVCCALKSKKFSKNFVLRCENDFQLRRMTECIQVFYEVWNLNVTT